MSESIYDRISQLVDTYGEGKNTVFASLIGVSEANVRNYKSGVMPKSDFFEKVARSCDVNMNWLITGEGSMTLSESGCDGQTRPRIPMTVAAGALNGFGDAVLSHQCEQIPVVKMLPDYDYTMIVKGDSMEPKFEGGDEIAIKRVSSIIEWGKPYVLDTRDGAILKRLYDAGDKFRCVSYNSEYSDIEVSKDDVFGIYRVVGLIRI